MSRNTRDEDEPYRSEPAVHAAIERVARQSYGQIIAYLATRGGDLAAAEDALSDAFLAAWQRWPVDGVPSKPEAWLLQVARNRLIDDARRNQTRLRSMDLLRELAPEAQTVATDQHRFPDERLKLLFICAHPAIDSAARTPLMLQTVLHIDATQIASAFLTSPAAMSQRLVRAKMKIREAAIPFRVPEQPEWSERLGFVLDAIYAAYTTGWESLPEAASTHHALTDEAITLGRLVVSLMPAEPEPRGLLALMLFCESRRDARYSVEGRYIPLDQQDMGKWSRTLMREASEQLRLASERKELGRYQLEAAIQAVHAQRSVTTATNWKGIAFLYEGLIRISSGIGSQVGRAVAIAQAGGPSEGLTALDAIPGRSVANYQPYWAARGHILELLKRNREARQAWERAIGLTDEPALRRYLMERSAGCGTL